MADDRFIIEGREYAHYTAFPAFFMKQSSRTSSTAGEIEVVMSVPQEGRLEAVSLMDTQGEELYLFVGRRVWDDDDE